MCVLKYLKILNSSRDFRKEKNISLSYFGGCLRTLLEMLRKVIRITRTSSSPSGRVSAHKFSIRSICLSVRQSSRPACCGGHQQAGWGHRPTGQTQTGLPPSYWCCGCSCFFCFYLSSSVQSSQPDLKWRKKEMTL